MLRKTIKPQFVEYVPDKLEEGILYISIEFLTAAHLCACGCGSKIVTPISPTDWKIIYDGENISLSPSIGNWSYPCQSHYWVEKNRIEKAAKWSQERINRGREYDKLNKEQYNSTEEDDSDNLVNKDETVSDKSLWEKIKSIFTK